MVRSDNMKFKKYPENKPTKSEKYIVKYEFLLGDEIAFNYTDCHYSVKHDMWNAFDNLSYEEQFETQFDAVVGYCEILDEGYED